MVSKFKPAVALAAVSSKMVVLLLLIHCLLLLPLQFIFVCTLFCNALFSSSFAIVSLGKSWLLNI